MTSNSRKLACARVTSVLAAVLVLTVLTPNSLWADQTIRFKQLSVVDGLSQDTINAVAQDHQGFIWLATQFGLNRYDGRVFETWHHDPNRPDSLPHDWVWSLFVDSSGHLWVGTSEAGLARFDPHDERFERVGQFGGHVRSIVEDAEGHIWAASDSEGVVRFHPDTGAMRVFDYASALPGAGRVRTMHVDPYGTLWLGTSGGGAFRYDALDERFVALSGVSANADIWDIEGGGREPLLLATRGDGLLELDVESGQIRDPARAAVTDEALASDNPRVLFRDSSGYLWIGHETRGLNRVDQRGRVETVRNDPAQPYSLRDDHIVSLFEDRNGLLWVGTQRGVSLWDPGMSYFRNFTRSSDPEHALSDNWVAGFAAAGPRQYWVATYGGGINLVDTERGRIDVLRHEPGAPSLADDRVMALEVDRHGMLWAGTSNAGISRLDVASGQWQHFRHDPLDPQSLADNGVTSLFEDRRGDLWVGTNRGGLHQFDRQSQQMQRVAVCHNRVLSITQDRAGALWLGTLGGGLCRFDPLTNEVTRYRHAAHDAHSLSSEDAWVVAEDAMGNLWVGTLDAGVNVWLLEDREAGRVRFHRFGQESGLASRVAYGILTDSRGGIWIASNRGLLRVSIDAQSNAAPRLVDLRHYTVADGLPTNEFNFGAALRTDTGKMLFGGTAGFTLFQPEAQQEALRTPQVALTAFYRLNERVSFDRQSPAFELGYADNVLTFEYAALDFAAPGQHRYQHWLEGFDNNWIEDGNRARATYTNLAPGNYLFKVRAALHDGGWGDNVLQIPVQVASPPWATPLAYFSYALVFALLGMWVYVSWSRKLAVAREIETMNRSLRKEVARRKAKEEALEREQATAQRYLDVVEVIILALDASGRVTLVNQKGARILGVSEGEVVGQDFTTEFVPADRRPEMEALLGEIDSYAYSEFPLQVRGGVERLIAWHTIRLPQDGENGGGVLMSGTDVTQMRKLESQLRDAQKMEALGTLARGVAHDFNNILSAILGYAELAKGQLPTSAPAQGYLGKLEGSVDRARQIISGILTFGRVTNLAPAPVNVSAVVAEALQLVRPVMPGNVRLIEDIEPECGPVLADSAQIVQVVLNLCTNACQSMAEAGGKLEVTLMHVNVDTDTARAHRVLQPGLHVRLSVTDTGPGMDEYTRSRVFEPFFTTRPQGEGTGLGLSVVHGIVSQLKGVVEVQTELNQGTTFSITLPCRTEFRPVSIDEQPVSAADLQGSETVLFVDDEEEVSGIAAEALSALGYSVLTASNAEDALVLLDTHGIEVDILITDQTMPGMRGEQMAAQVKVQYPEMPVLLVSGADQPGSSSVDDFLSKPYAQEHLARKVRQLLAKASSE